MIASCLYHLYAVRRRSLRSLIRRILYTLEGGEFYSTTLRRIFRDYYNVDIGLYTHGSCFVPGAMDPYTTVGRYCSIAAGVRVLNQNHPMDLKSTHGFFFNPTLGYCRRFYGAATPLTIGHDVWIGHGALIYPHTKHIGHGAVIAAGAVVNKDVPPYAVVVGHPARVVRFRFPKDVIDHLLASHWWDTPIEALDIDEFTRPYVPDRSEATRQGLDNCA